MITVATRPPLADLAALASSLRPLLADRAAAAETARRVSEETIREFRDAGLFRLLQPARFGGHEGGFDALIELAMELGSACGSSAWLLVILNSGWFVAGFPPDAQHEIWDTQPDALIGNVLAPSTEISTAPGGYCVTGRWPFCSGIDHVDWQIVSGFTYTPSGHPDVRLFAVPRSAFEIEDDWFVVGLRATGSRTLILRDLFVPEHRTARLADFREGCAPGTRLHDNAEYRLPMGVVFPLALCSPLIGMAFGGLEEWKAHTRTALTRGPHRAAEQQSAQIHLAESAAEIDTARLLLRRDLADVRRIAAGEERPALYHRVRSRRDGAYIAQLCVRAIDRLFAASGGAGLYDRTPLHRFWRDIHAAAAHVGLRWEDAARVFGRAQFGLPMDPCFFD